MPIHLNAEQQRAVNLATTPPRGARPKMVHVEGPPGTGKTTVVAAIAKTYIASSHVGRSRPQVVILYYTNNAADRCVEALSEQGITPAQACRIAYRAYRVDPRWGDWYVTYDRESDLTLEDLSRLREVQIIVATTHQARKAMELTRRPLVILDEISQVSIADYLGSIAYAKDRGRDFDYTVLVGDPHQLPVVTHQEELEINAMAFLRARAPELNPAELRVQYRMHESICGLVNSMRMALKSYGLFSDPSVAHRTLREIYGTPTSGCVTKVPREVIDPEVPVVVINTDRLGGGEERTRTSWKYSQEAALSVEVARALRGAYGGLDPVLLSPYDAQIDVMKGASNEEFRALTVHDMQGREYDAVVLSMVRKNDDGGIGFIGTMLPISYVAFSRPKVKLVVLLSWRTFDKTASLFPREVMDFLGGKQVKVIDP
jgi:hypothetical protein